MKRYTIHQTFECDNKWDEMTPQGQGRHCGSCNKIVVDFTQMPDKDIIQYLLKNKDACGLFKKNQLNRPIVIHAYKKRSNWPAIAAMLVAGLFAVAPNNTHAINPVQPSIEFHSTGNKEVEPEKTTHPFPIKLLNSKTNSTILWGSVYVDGLGTFFADETGTIHVVDTIKQDLMPDSFIITVNAGGYVSKTFTIYTKDISESKGATIYLDQMIEEISPPGMVAIYEDTIPQKPKYEKNKH